MSFMLEVVYTLSDQNACQNWRMKTAAFFDLDNTLVKGSSIYYLARRLISAGHVTRRELVGFSVSQARFIRTKTEDSETISKVTKKALATIAGKSEQELRALCEEIVHDFLPKKLFNSVKSLVEQHQNQGHHTWLVTASPIEIARATAKSLGMTGALGTVSETKNGYYTGALVGPILHGPVKAEAIKVLALEQNYQMDSCYGYSDSVNDLPLLATVGNPVAVNPNDRLSDTASKNLWPIHLPN